MEVSWTSDRGPSGRASGGVEWSIPALPLSAAVSGPNILFYQDHYLNGPQIDATVLHGIYNAATISDDAVRVWVDGKLEAERRIVTLR